MTYYPPAVLIAIICAAWAAILAWCAPPAGDRRKPSARTQGGRA